MARFASRSVRSRDPARRRRRFALEALEARNLLSSGLYEYPLPSSGGAGAPVPEFLTLGPDGHIWFTLPVEDMIGEFDPNTHSYSLYSVPTYLSTPRDLTVGPDGNIWFTERNANQLGMINPSTHVISEFSTGTNAPQDIVTGPDGNLWFTSFGKAVGGSMTDSVGMIDPTTHAVTEFPLTAPSSSNNPIGFILPQGIATGPDGNLWFVEAFVARIGMIDPTTHVITEFPIPGEFNSPERITAGPDGNLWFTENTYSDEHIGIVNVSTHSITTFPLAGPNSMNASIVTGADGNLWFTGEALVGSINPATHATVLYPLPAGFTESQGIVAGANGDLWVATENGNAGGQIDRVVINDVGGHGIPLISAGGGLGTAQGSGGGGGGGSVGSDPGGSPVDSPPVMLGVIRLTKGKGRKRKTVGFELEFSSSLDAPAARDVTHYRVTQAGLRKRSPRKVVRVKSAIVRGDDRIDLTLGAYNAKKALALTIDGLVGVDGTEVATIQTNL